MLLAVVTETPVPTAAEMESMFPWYTWVAAAAIVVLLIGVKMYKNKTMT